MVVLAATVAVNGRDGNGGGGSVDDDVSGDDDGGVVGGATVVGDLQPRDRLGMRVLLAW